eukprot:3232414-Rhodomonas_salina.1
MYLPALHALQDQTAKFCEEPWFLMTEDDLCAALAGAKIDSILLDHSPRQAREQQRVIESVVVVILPDEWEALDLETDSEQYEQGCLSAMDSAPGGIGWVPGPGYNNLPVEPVPGPAADVQR